MLCLLRGVVCLGEESIYLNTQMPMILRLRVILRRMRAINIGKRQGQVRLSKIFPAKECGFSFAGTRKS